MKSDDERKEMIESKDDLKKYINEDRIANAYYCNRPLIIGNEIWKFLIALRKYEYRLNCLHGLLRKIVLLLDKIRWYRKIVKIGITIYPNTFEEGLTIYHYGCIISNGKMKAGKNVTVLENCIIANFSRFSYSNDTSALNTKVY